MQLEVFVCVGAGINQVSLIIAAKNLGYFTVAIDKNTQAPGFAYSDARIVLPVNYTKEIIDCLSLTYGINKISGVATKSYGLAISTVAAIAEYYKIRIYPTRVCNAFISKIQAREFFKNSKLPFIRNNVSSSELKYPLVAKPEFGGGKIGVELLSNEAVLKKKISNNNGRLLIDEYLRGEEILVLGIVANGIFNLIEISDKIIDRETFVDLGHITPSKFIFLADKIHFLAKEVIHLAKINSAPLMFELLITPDNSLHIIEIVLEFGGEFIADILIPNRCNYNVNKNVVLAMSNRDIDSPPHLTSSDRVPTYIGFTFDDKITKLKEKFICYCKINSAHSNITISRNSARQYFYCLQADSRALLLEKVGYYKQLLED